MVKNPPANAEDAGSIPGFGKIPWRKKWQPTPKLPAMQETQAQSPGQEDAPEKEISTHSSILAWRIPWTEEPGGPQSMGLQRVGHD